MQRLIQPIKDTWKRKRVSICSDGWSDRQRRPLINIMATSIGGPIFVKAIDASGNIKSMDYIAGIFLECIEEIGAANVVQIVTDNAANYKAAGQIIETKYPHIFWTPCVVHSLNLALKSMCEASQNSDYFSECEWISKLVNEVHEVRNFITNHNLALSIFKRHSKLNLLKVADTRFASNIISAERLKAVKDALEKMVMDSDWKSFKGYGKVIEGRARAIKECIVNDNWWDQIDFFLSFTKPILDMLRAADKDSPPILHFIYDMWDSMIENEKKIIFEHEGLDVKSEKKHLSLMPFTKYWRLDGIRVTLFYIVWHIH